MATDIRIPSWENPIHRFKKGRAELQTADTGAAFGLLEAVASFEDDAYPLAVADVELTQREVYQSASALLGDPSQREQAEELIGKAHVDAAEARLVSWMTNQKAATE